MNALSVHPVRLAVVVLVSAAVLAGCGEGGSSSSVSCSGDTCTATVTGAPIEVSTPDTSDSGGGSRTGTRTTRRTASGSGPDEVDFTLAAMGPGWVEVSDDGGPATRIAQGGTFVEDDATIRLESSDGRTAVLTFPRP